MRVGVLVRADDRGLGVQTRDACRHLDASPLYVVPHEAKTAGYPQRFDDWPDARRVGWDGERFDDVPTVLRWLKRLDVVYSAETFYDDGFVDMADALDVATVLHVNPEFFLPSRPRPSVLWLPTPWRRGELPALARLVPMPVAADEAPDPAEPPSAEVPVTFLHVVGRRAVGDRNGTGALIAALRYLAGPCVVRVTTQDNRLPAPAKVPRGVAYRPQMGHVENRWDLYRGAHVLVMPRRFGGLCLPVQEAMAAGLAVIMSDTSPNEFWPTVRVSATAEEPVMLDTAAGSISMVSTHGRALASAMLDLGFDPDRLLAARTASLEWARQHSWAAMTDTWTAELAHAVDVARFARRRKVDA